MIVNQFKDQAFSRALNYVLHKPGARYLGSNTFCRNNSQEFNQAMQSVAEQSPRTQRPLMHYAISLAPSEHLSDHQWRSLAREYLKRMGYDNNQYVLVKHRDTPHHEHVHLLVNRVRLSGTAVALNWDYYKSQTVVRELEADYNLLRIRSSWEPYQKLAPLTDLLVTQADLPEAVQKRLDVQSQLREQIMEALVQSDDIIALLQQLERGGIQVNRRYRKQTLVGISFDLEGEHFTGRGVGNSYSLPQLVKQLESKRNGLSASSADRPESVEAERDRIRHSREGPTREQQQYREHYEVMSERIRQELGDGCRQEQIDLQFAILILRSGHPQLKHVLAQSPDIQRRLREQGEEAAWGYGRELMARAQRWLDDIQQQSRDRRDELERD